MTGCGHRPRSDGTEETCLACQPPTWRCPQCASVVKRTYFGAHSANVPWEEPPDFWECESCRTVCIPKREAEKQHADLRAARQERDRLAVALRGLVEFKVMLPCPTIPHPPESCAACRRREATRAARAALGESE